MIGLFTIEGRKVWEMEIVNDEIKFDVSELQAGIYIIRIQSDEKNYSEKLIIK
jgi:hypothetical protein